MKKLLFVVNGHSGKGQIKYKLLDIIDILIKEGYHVQVHTTQEREDAQEVQTIFPILWRFQKI